MGKGSKRRLRQVSQEEESLRWMLIDGQISLATFNQRYAELKREGLLRRSGRVLK